MPGEKEPATSSSEGPKERIEEVEPVFPPAPGGATPPSPSLEPHGQDQMDRLFLLIRSELGNDMRQYTLDRWIERRMSLHGLETLEDYVRFAQSDRGELQALCKDVLIAVTSFFRGPEAYEALESQVLPRLFQGREPGRPLRVWVPACATGEEAYSIAICLLEYCEEHGLDTPIQMFGTDIDEKAIQHARRGVYPANIAEDVSRERLDRFFVKKGDEYHVDRTLREPLIFSRQNVLQDPPFSRMDLVSCRNLLIYLRPDAQRRVLRTLHYALGPGGFLMLGPSEIVGDGPNLFSAVDRKHRLYARKPIGGRAALDSRSGVELRGGAPAQPRTPRPIVNLQGLADRKVLELYGPPGVIVSEELEILQFRGHTGLYLDPSPGSASWNLLRVAKLEFRMSIKKAFQEAKARQRRATVEVVCPDGETQSAVQVDVVPVLDPESQATCFMVLFSRLPPPREVPVPAGGEGNEEAMVRLARRLQEVERELAVTKEYLQAIAEERESTLAELQNANEELQSTLAELQSSNEELQSTNEELQSSNEELKTANEEMENSKEELQSTNEELTTVNEELQARMAELSLTNDDLHNVLAGVENPVVIVGMDLKIRRFTAAAERLFNLLPADVGRPVGLLDTLLGTGALEAKVSSVIQSLSTVEEEIRAGNQRWYALKISLYKTLDHSVRGALLTLVDIDVRKRSQQVASDVTAYADRFLAPIDHPLLIVDRKLRVLWCNTSFLAVFQITFEETVGNLLPAIGARQLGEQGLLGALEKVFTFGHALRDFPMRISSLAGRKRRVKIGASKVPATSDGPQLLLSIELSRDASRQESP